MKLANLATAAVFAVFLAAPLGSLAVKGLDPAAEKVVTMAELTSGQLLTPDDNYRNDVARRLVTNSPVGMDAIRTKNTLDFKVFGFVNTTQVVSGEDGWLFYKPSFSPDKCLSPKSAPAILGRIEALRAVAAATGIDLRFSVSPDKEVVYPDKLGPGVTALVGCKLETAREWRRMVKRAGSSLIDHLDVLRHDFNDALLYLRTDTHWNDLGKVRILGQLARVYLGTSLSPDPIPSGEATRKNDMLNTILRTKESETFAIYNDFLENVASTKIKNKITSMLIVHDSFYALSKDFLAALFAEPSYVAYGSSTFRADLDRAFSFNPRHVLVNSVEREFFYRLWAGEFAWKKSLGIALLKRNEDEARKCDVSNIRSDELTLLNLSEGTRGTYLAKGDPQIHIRLRNGGRPCLRISFQADARESSALYLKAKLDGEPDLPAIYQEGFKVELASAGDKRDFAIVLPAEFSGKEVRFDPFDGPGRLSGLQIETGTLPVLDRRTNTH